jgi:ubiquinone/menaquinone biosynthesis C-methylase UbiE
MMRSALRRTHTCPWWLAYTFDNPLRGLVHRPADVLGGLVRRGDTVADMGCGLGFFTLALAELVGPAGKVFAVDLQQEMLSRTRRRAERRGVADRIRFVQATMAGTGLSEHVDFVLAFWMVHEVADRDAFLAEVHSLLKPTGHLLIAEPKGHVPAPFFARITEQVASAGFTVKESRDIRFSRALLCVPGQDIA